MRETTAITALAAMALASARGAGDGGAGVTRPTGAAPGAEPQAAGAALHRALPAVAARVLGATGGRAPIATAVGFELAPARGATTLDVELPRRVDGPVRLQAGAFEVRVREIAAPGAEPASGGASEEGAIVEGAIAYRHGRGASFWRSAPGGAEEWVHLRAGTWSPNAAAAAWEVEGAAPAQRGRAVALHDGTGAARI